jgi:glycosyltransferase involved in cell wall biosynthesis
MTGGPSEPRFSVVLPTHNRADVLPFAIESALRQTDDRFELLIAGDGCTDGTADAVRSFADPRIHWFDLPKAPGVGYANRNIALRQARAPYVAYLAHDDLWFPDHLERLGRLLDDTGADLVHSRLLSVDVDGELRPYGHNLEVPSHRADLARARMAISISCVAHTRSSLERFGGWDEQLLSGGDIDLWHRIAGQSSDRVVGFVSDPTALHFVASWKNTATYRRRRRLARRLVDGLSSDVPVALRLEIAAGEAPQAAGWRRISSDPQGFMRTVRHAVVQYHDALLWRAESTAGLIPFRAGASLGTFVDHLWTRARRLTSPNLRRLDRALKGTQQDGRPGWGAGTTGGGNR